MSDTTQASIDDEAKRLIDQGLGDVSGRQIIPSDEVTDLLLDLRSLLAATPSTKN